ncbi:MAG: hypothetical protein LBC41_01690 [Clostridiales bacterium]|jgi:hypothetical protein|nr:hypothetical protein [Clostridiales bacterium]
MPECNYYSMLNHHVAARFHKDFNKSEDWQADQADESLIKERKEAEDRERAEAEKRSLKKLQEMRVLASFEDMRTPKEIIAENENLTVADVDNILQGFAQLAKSRNQFRLEENEYRLILQSWADSSQSGHREIEANIQQEKADELATHQKAIHANRQEIYLQILKRISEKEL